MNTQDTFHTSDTSLKDYQVPKIKVICASVGRPIAISGPQQVSLKFGEDQDDVVTNSNNRRGSWGNLWDEE